MLPRPNFTTGHQLAESSTGLSRYQLLRSVFLLALIVILLQLFNIQIIHHQLYLKKAEAMQTNKQIIKAVRGRIFVQDIDGKVAPLVMNRSVYTLFADPSSIKKLNQAKQLIEQVAGHKLIKGSLAKLNNKKLQYVVLAKHLDSKQAAKIKQANLYGLGLQADTLRVYPEGELASQVLGFVNHDGIGQYGVEQFYDKQLSGKDGVLQTVTDVSKIPLTIGAKDISSPARDGDNIVLTIDRNVQSQAEQFLADGLKNAKATKGSILVMNPQNGRILAMANLPTYSPSNYAKVDSASVYQNNTISNAYEPGSIMKLFTVGAGLNEGAISPSSTFYNPSCIQVDDAKICNVEKSVSGQMMNPTQLLQYSLNTGAVWVLEQLGGGHINLAGRQKLYNYLANNYRLNNPTGVDLANEVDSVIYKPNIANGVRVLYANMTFGQGEQLTMIQVLSAFAAAINGGNYYQPSVKKGILKDQQVVESQSKIVAKNVLRPGVSATLRDMLYQARYLGAGGKNKDNGYYVGGKSGTAQKVDLTTGKYSDSLTTGTYLGFGADKTKVAKYVIMVRVDDAHNGGYSGSAAAQPIFDQMSNFMIQYEGVSK